VGLDFHGLVLRPKDIEGSENKNCRERINPDGATTHGNSPD
jgi:hypothetical protein